MADRDRAREITSLRRRSHQWMNNNFYEQWTQAYKSYKCEVEPKKDDNDGDKDDLTQTAIGMPDTWSIVNRQVARITAQPPNLRYLAADRSVAERISRKLMYDWDRGNIQRIQKKHVRQGVLFGWSVRAWSWDTIEYTRRKRINPLAASAEDMDLIQDQYRDDIVTQMEALRGEGLEPEGPGSPEVMTELLRERGRGVNPPTLSVEYNYKKYEGPKADFLFVGDCFPEPNFQTIQSSGYFIVRRRHNEAWMKRTAKRYPEFSQGLQALITKYPNGTPAYRATNRDESQDLFLMLQSSIGRSDDLLESQQDEIGNKEWTFWEAHYPGENARLALVGEEDFFVGEIPYPYDLDGMIAFTELILIDDLLSGIGDSHARIIRGLQLLHDRQYAQRQDLIYNVLRPLVGTNDRSLIDNPQSIKRGKGFRLVLLDGPGAIFPVVESSALAAAAAAMGDEASIHQAIQQATGESNMTMAANVDPQQTRTATGARLMAFNQDILTKDANDMFITNSVNADAEMMYLLNRSEMPESVTFDASRYNRAYSLPEQTRPGLASADQPNEMTVSPLDFQIDGQVEAEAGSTLADDDEGKVQQAQNLFAAAVGAPQVFNVQKAAEEYLVSQGKGRDLSAWMAPPQPPSPTAEPLKESLSISIKFETLGPDVQRRILERAELVQPGEPILSIDPLPELLPLGGDLDQGGRLQESAPPATPGPAGDGFPGVTATQSPPAGQVEMGPATRAAIGTRVALGS